MHPLNDDSPEPRHRQADPARAGCPGCAGCQPNPTATASDSPELSQPGDAEPEPSVSHLLLAPIGLFVLPIVTAVLGAAWGNAAAAGELLGGLLGLLLGMGAAILVARVIDWRKRAKTDCD